MTDQSVVADPRVEAVRVAMMHRGRRLHGKWAAVAVAAADAADAAAGIQRLTTEEVALERVVGAAFARSNAEDLLATYTPLIDALVLWRSKKLALGPTAAASGVSPEEWVAAHDEMRAAQQLFLRAADQYVTAEWNPPGGDVVTGRTWACAEAADPDLWFSSAAADIERAIEICNRCPAKAACERLRSDITAAGYSAIGVWHGAAHGGLGWHNPAAAKDATRSQAEVRQRRLELYMQGWTDRQIFEELGGSVDSIREWRRYRRLAANKPAELMGAAT